MNPVKALENHRQAVWLDFLARLVCLELLACLGFLARGVLGSLGGVALTVTSGRPAG